MHLLGMKKLKNIVFFLLILGCKSENIFENSITFESFPKKEKLKPKFLHKMEDIAVDGLLAYNDSTLLIRHKANSSKYHFSTFDINKKLITTNLLEAGSGQNQSMAFLSYGVMDNEVWVFDIVKNELITTRIDTNVTANDLLSRSESNFYYNIQPINDSIYLGSGDYDSDFRFSFVNLRNNEVVKRVARYPKNISRAQKNSYESFLFINPSRDKAVLAGRYTDMVQVLNLENDESVIHKGPEDLTNYYDVMVRGDGKEISVRNDRTRYAFVKGATTNNFIYLLYSGNIHNGSNLYYGKEVFVYDWQGKPIKKLILPDYILDIAISSDDSIIYTYNPKTGSIEFSNLEL
tara:strand:- start:8072 stop:9115 length:1044 start_codon:yes stop_codon:yes gene_type:complete